MTNGNSRKRNASSAGFDTSSPASMSASHSPEFDRGGTGYSRHEDSHGDGDEQTQDGKRRPVKRACNECRQQKLRCDVVQEPFQTCSRCKRLRLDCKIEDNFKRVGKRSRNAEMEREIVELRKQVVAQQNGTLLNNALQQQQRNTALPSPLSTAGNGGSYAHDAAAGLLDLRTAYEKNQTTAGRGQVIKRLEDVAISYERAQELFQRFFTLHHPFLPFLAVERSPEEYHHRSPLLFWTIIAIGARNYTADPNLYSSLTGPLTRLIWTTVADVPQNYHVVKALILICAWPLPTSSTSSDATFMLCGLMMQIAMQIGLHRPNHAQDFSKFRIELREVELQDRVVVWSACNITAQRICTAYGQPPLTIYDWTLGPKPIESNPNYEMPQPVYSRLLIEKFVDKVTRTLYMNPQDPVGLATDHERPMFVSFLTQDLQELQASLRNDTSPITNIYLKAAVLHMRLSAFFSPPALTSYRADMLKCYTATIEFLEACLNLESESSVSMNSTYTHGLSLAHGTNYIFHMMLAAGFSLLKLMHNFLGQHELDTNGASELLTRTIWTLKSMSVVENDLPERLSEVLTQVWKTGRIRPVGMSSDSDVDAEDSLQLKVKCRMSMSLVFDSVWRWRKNFRFTGGKPSEVRIEQELSTDLQSHGLHATTNVNSTLLDPSSSLLNDPSSATGTNLANPLVGGMSSLSNPTGMLDDFNMDYGQANYEVFDPLNWMLDGLVDFPYAFGNGTGLDGSLNSGVGLGVGNGGMGTIGASGGNNGLSMAGLGGAGGEISGGVVMSDSLP